MPHDSGNCRPRKPEDSKQPKETSRKKRPPCGPKRSSLNESQPSPSPSEPVLYHRQVSSRVILLSNTIELLLRLKTSGRVRSCRFLYCTLIGSFCLSVEYVINVSKLLGYIHLVVVACLILIVYEFI